ncbi:G patch domain-containing protein 1 [Pyrenochaeta sp. DS3sAY3a]|nr:G patch domain-containing protein 1 [Pyrenochaeta sp. DS3sAY3a]
MSYKRPRQSSPHNANKRSRGKAHSTYISLGTELPDQDGDDGAFVPEWKQTVTDEQGRRRLHGAFTGGFSAGYFNTVGSKEGWKPTTFVSSRKNRKDSSAFAQRPEDFMDKEDLAQAAESRHLETAHAFAGIGGSGQAHDNGSFGLFLTQEDTMGVKLAQKMGWRRDQGIGRKVRRNARLDDGSEPTVASVHLFAPQDTRAMIIPREEVRRKGLGYSSEARLSVREETEFERPNLLQFDRLERPKQSSMVHKPPTKQSSFGVGVLNDTGSDDEDPYDLGPKISFNKTLGKDKKGKKPSKFAKAGAGNKHLFVSKKQSPTALVSLPKHSMDGRLPLNGFTLAAGFSELNTKPKYPPPKIPAGWKSSKHTPPTSSSEQYTSVADAARASTLNAKDRADLLGEKALPGKSIFDFIPKEARDRLANLSGKSDLPQGLGQPGPTAHLPADKAQPKDLWSLIPSLDKSLAAGALAKGATGWMPYAEDLPKRARYIGFLELRAGLEDDLPERLAGVSISDWTKELQEFAHAAQVFKPATGLMASRFTSSRSTSEGAIADNLLRPPPAKPADPAEEAAKLNMHGAMTRSVFPFYPSSLLCKRFNVKAPPHMRNDPDAGTASHKRQTEEPVSKSAMEQMRMEILTNPPAPDLQRPSWMGRATSSLTTESAAATAAAESQPQPGARAVVDVEKNEALAHSRAPEDVFKDIFGDDDEDDE